MNGLRKLLGIVTVSCLGIAPVANAALEKAAGKASTSATLAHTSANAWALETDPAVTPGISEVPPPLTDYYFTAGQLNNIYDTSQFTLDGDNNGLPDFTHSVTGQEGFQVTSYDVAYYANSNGFTDPESDLDTYSGGYPYIQVTLTPTPNNPMAATDTFVPDADGNLPDINLPVGQINDIMFNLPITDGPSITNDDSLGGNPNVTIDQYLFQFNFSGPENADIVDALNGVTVDDNSFLTAFDPSDDSTITVSGSNISGAEVPEPASLSVLGACAAGLLFRRRPGQSTAK
jgi:PEP-CTERM motif